MARVVVVAVTIVLLGLLVWYSPQETQPTLEPPTQTAPTAPVIARPPTLQPTVAPTPVPELIELRTRLDPNGPIPAGDSAYALETVAFTSTSAVQYLYTTEHAVQLPAGTRVRVIDSQATRTAALIEVTTGRYKGQWYVPQFALPY